MTQLSYSFIIPVYNRPKEIEELLESFLNLEGNFDYEIVIVEDGSTETSENVICSYIDKLNISYYFKSNSGPGDSRNYGMQRAKGNYYIILDSDVILPEQYLQEVDNFLKQKFYHCFGGPDGAHDSFSDLQKAINFSMTSFMTTGGIRGGSEAIENFQPRSFNLGLSQEAYKATKGFGKIHPGEDPDLILRLWEMGYKTSLIKNAFVYHKRRISWNRFYKQVNKFGQVRPILNKWHPSSAKITYWFPTLFLFVFVISLLLSFVGLYHLLLLYGIYFLILFASSFLVTKNIKVAIMSIGATCIQFYGYGIGFFKSTIKLLTTKKSAETIFPNLFFK
ncbi:glycosyl transferase family 2 [Winogradskyella sp. PC-19]|uniref:glycosyltransferase n=1 Tax=unclassified Winogradskyella TaxID=2615021 RepID=UPI000B3C544C|nr:MULTISPECIES: glycosyltransferase [unclassified Winogradskyella]ARV08140.1 glycosyl transferase family 2 [Winogradskyella sp. PC-19]